MQAGSSIIIISTNNLLAVYNQGCYSNIVTAKLITTMNIIKLISLQTPTACIQQKRTCSIKITRSEISLSTIKSSYLVHCSLVQPVER